MRRPISGGKGMALIAVLWTVAALSIAATGLMYSATQEIKMAARQHNTVVAMASADAAVRLVLQELVAHKAPLKSPEQAIVEFGGHLIRVRVQSLNGFININRAPEPLLAAMLVHGGGVPPGLAAQLAATIVQWRSRPASDGRPVGFDAPEDLLRVPGVDYDLYASIAPLISASLSGSGLVDPRGASLPVLVVLAQGNIALARKLYAVREHSPGDMDTTQLSAAFLEASSGRGLSIQAEVPIANNLVLRRVWDVALTASGRTGLPWNVVAQRHSIAAASSAD